MRNYNLLNEVVIEYQEEKIIISGDDIKTKLITKEKVIKTYLGLIMFLKKKATMEEYEEVIDILEDHYCCKFDDIYIDENVIKQIKEILEV